MIEIIDIAINNLSQYRENNRIEAKKAKGGLPGSLWEPHSSFTNTDGGIRIGLKAALSGGISDPRIVTIMKMFGLVDIGERAGSGIPDFINTWQKYVEFNPVYEITHNPDRTKLTIPYTIAALQKVGSKLVDGVQVANSDTKDTSIDSTKTNLNTKNINDRAKIKCLINDRLKTSTIKS